MGTSYAANCKCGYEGSAVVGSGRAHHGKVFKYPHACDHCLAVVSIDMLSGDLACPKCGNPNVKAYDTPIEKPKKRFFFWQKKIVKPWAAESNCYVLKKTFALPLGPCYCPCCQAPSLRFTISMLFD